MLFLAGPRQVGKTTTSQSAKMLTSSFHYFNWDNQDDRAVILSGPSAIVRNMKLDVLSNDSTKPIVVFDEIHKYSGWKQFLKGFFDTYNQQINIIVTGSSRLDIYKKGGDSLMGRYFLYRMHPISIAEYINAELSENIVRAPKCITADKFDNLLKFGGFPKPLLQQDARFYAKWQRLRQQQLLTEDIRDVTKIQEVSQLEILAVLLKEQSGQLVNYSNLAKKIRVSVDTVRRWIKTLEALYYCFTITPWSKNITRSLLKEPKTYMWDWSVLQDEGSKLENFVASHLLKAVHYWTDQGFGTYNLHFLRDLEKREVDFLVVKDAKPWFLVEVKKSSNNHISKSLYHFQSQTKAPHAFQAVFDLDYVNQDCFLQNKPIIVPVQTLLSQLI
ncbi:MAG: hypothetical protein COB50_03155 [Thiotrichales bacterium]|nr:MAG: hypothetical protein COB50_03155 [Thiotrichales bacterium]